MGLHIPQLLNAVTMVFPLMAWWKHRKHMKKNPLHRIMKVHMPVSIIYHLSAAIKGIHGKCNFRDFLLHVDIFCIHASSFISSIGAILKAFKHTPALRTIYFVTSFAMHSHAFAKNIKKDQSFYRFGTLIFSAFPVFLCIDGIGLKMCKYGIIGFVLYINDDKIKIGHSCFHVILFKVYDTFFINATKINELWTNVNNTEIVFSLE